MSSLAPYSVATRPTSLQPQRFNYSSSKPSRLSYIIIGLALSCGILHAFSQPQATSAAEAVPCELKVAPSGLAFCDEVVGTGSPPIKGQSIQVHYVGRLENGEIFDSSYDRGQPLNFRVGLGQVIKGLDEGILGGDGIPPMLIGGKRTLKIPPELGYGSRGVGPIPPDSVLLFDLLLVSRAGSTNP